MNLAQQITAFKAEKTPFYFYDLTLLRKTLESAKQEADKHNFHIHYALKANANPRLISEIKQIGFGADCVSGNEVKCAIDNAFDKNKIVFAGVGKTDDEMNYALANDIFCFNCESIQELSVLNDLAANANKKARIALRINPNVNANTHKYITTGLDENKFGISAWQFDAVVEALKSLNNIEVIGLHFHIGSQITDLDVYKNLCTRVLEIQYWFENRGLQFTILNVGGGLGVDYANPTENAIVDFASYFQIFNRFLPLKPKQEVHFELGRALVAQCGNLISRVLYIKEGINTNFAIIDAGMNDLIRPALYQTFHHIENLSAKNEELTKYDVVGPICESSDCFGRGLLLPSIKRGDIIAIRTAGAYGEVMSSNYNLKEKAASFFI
jgi:diaminopimelate decarboxylase